VRSAVKEKRVLFKSLTDYISIILQKAGGKSLTKVTQFRWKVKERLGVGVGTF
jgi:hypothetical protein